MRAAGRVRTERDFDYFLNEKVRPDDADRRACAAPSARHSRRDDPLWYKDAVIYQLHVKAFFDSNGDGIGDFRGLTEKLDYMQDLGVNTIWLLPFYPSPLRDDGYDIADYTTSTRLRHARRLPRASSTRRTARGCG